MGSTKIPNPFTAAAEMSKKNFSSVFERISLNWEASERKDKISAKFNVIGLGFHSKKNVINFQCSCRSFAPVLREGISPLFLIKNDKPSYIEILMTSIKLPRPFSAYQLDGGEQLPPTLQHYHLVNGRPP